MDDPAYVPEGTKIELVADEDAKLSPEEADELRAKLVARGANFTITRM